MRAGVMTTSRPAAAAAGSPERRGRGRQRRGSGPGETALRALAEGGRGSDAGRRGAMGDAVEERGPRDPARPGAGGGGAGTAPLGGELKGPIMADFPWQGPPRLPPPGALGRLL